MTLGSAGSRLGSARRPTLRAAPGTASLSWSRALGIRLAPLIQATRLDELMTLAVRVAEEISQGTDGFLVLVDGRTHEVDLASARDARGLAVRPAQTRPLFAGEGVLPRLGHGVHVTHGTESETTLLLPLVHDSTLHAVLGVTLPGPKHPLGRAVEPLRDLCQQAAPLLARLREIGELHTLVAGLTQLVQEGARHEVRRRELEDDVRGARLELALRANLNANLNHALRTPLAAIRGYARLMMEDGTTPGHSPRQHLDVIVRNAERLVEIAANLACAPRVRPRLAPVDVRECWNTALAEPRQTASTRGVSLVEAVPDVSVPLLADEGHLRRMLAELVAGGLETTARGQVLRAELLDESQRIVVKITSGGESASEGALRKADEPAGRSLRLDTARELANLHGGRLTVVHESAGHHVYSVTLPRVSLEE